MDISLQYSWVKVENALGQQYSFPEPLADSFRNRWAKPSVYRWVIVGDQEPDIRRIYIGETELLHRRIYHYLKPGPSQRTNQCLKALFEREVEFGSRVVLESLDFQPFTMEGLTVSMTSLSDKAVRRFLENLFVMYYSLSGYEVWNL